MLLPSSGGRAGLPRRAAAPALATASRLGLQLCRPCRVSRRLHFVDTPAAPKAAGRRPPRLSTALGWASSGESKPSQGASPAPPAPTKGVSRRGERAALRTEGGGRCCPHRGGSRCGAPGSPRGGPTSPQAEGGRAPAVQGCRRTALFAAPPGAGGPRRPPAKVSRAQRDGGAGPPKGSPRQPRGPRRGRRGKGEAPVCGGAGGVPLAVGRKDAGKWRCSGWGELPCTVLEDGGPGRQRGCPQRGARQPPPCRLAAREACGGGRLAHTGLPPRGREHFDGKCGLGGLKRDNGI